MRRAIARGRVFPQSYSTDRRFGRLSLKAVALFPLLWVNGDDQGRIQGDPEEVKYSTCPNIDHLTKADIPELLKELEREGLIFWYDSPKGKAIQFVDWWNVQKLQWAYPSDYPPRNGWKDRLRYKQDRETVITINWPTKATGDSGVHQPNVQVNSVADSGEPPVKPPLSPPPSPRPSSAPLISPREPEGEREEEEGSSPEKSGEPSPSPNEISRELEEGFAYAFGKKPDSRERAQLRDLMAELSYAGVTIQQIKDAYREAGLAHKHSVSYIRAILCDWLGLPRERVRAP